MRDNAVRSSICCPLALVLAISCSIPGSQTPSASSPPSVLISNYNGKFSYTVDVGSKPKDVYFVFSNTSLDTTEGAATVKNVAGPIKVDGAEIADSSAQPAGGTSATSTRLKDFLARSNRDISSLLSGGGLRAAADMHVEVGGPKYSDTNGLPGAFWDMGSNNTTVSVSSTCRNTPTAKTLPDGTTRTLNIWVADDCWSGSGTVGIGVGQKRHLVTQAMVDDLSAKFLTDGLNDIYGYDTEILGPEWGPTAGSQYASYLIPFNGEITILLSDIEQDNSDSGGYVGYFWPGNNFLPPNVTGTNSRIMFVIDAVMYANPNANGSSSTGGTGWSTTNYWAEEVFSTLAHEFQHMIQFYRKGIIVRGDGNTADTWIDEMCSQLIEDLVAEKLGGRGPRGVSTATGDAGSAGNPYGRIPDFNQLLSYQLTKTSGYGLYDYSFSYAFGAWLMRNFGGASFVKGVVYDPATDSTCVTNAVNAAIKSSGRSYTMADLLTRWAVAVLGSDRTDMPPGYSFNTGGWTTSAAGSLTYKLGSIDFFNYSPAPQVLTGTGSVPHGSIARSANVYYLAAGALTGSKSWTLDLPQGVGFSVVVTP